MLGIPCMVDWLIQQALHQVLQYRLDSEFSNSCFGFRPGRSAHQALQQAQAYVAQGRRWGVDMDLEKFFDGFNHDIQMARVARKDQDKRVLGFIRRFLPTGMMENRLVSQRTRSVVERQRFAP